MIHDTNARFSLKAILLTISVVTLAEIILGMDSVNERRCYIVTSSLIGWAHSQNDRCLDVFVTVALGSNTLPFHIGLLTLGPFQNQRLTEPSLYLKHGYDITPTKCLGYKYSSMPQIQRRFS